AGCDRFDAARAFTGFGTLAATFEPGFLAVLADALRQSDDQGLMRFGTFVLDVPEQPAGFHRHTEPEMMIGQHDGDFGVRRRSRDARCGQEHEDGGRGAEAPHGYAIALAASRA